MEKIDSNRDPTVWQNDLDWAQFEAITCGLLPKFIDIYREFERELPQLLKELQKAIATSSFEEVIRLAHQIKGSAANFGFIGTSQAMHELEWEAQKKLLKNAEKYLNSAQKAFEHARLKVNSRIY